ncbi:MAG: TetR/AcrR family transcriptional regulator [Ignavibacteriaceae bacterium]|jgi:AcrR family transcriptional regulator
MNEEKNKILLYSQNKFLSEGFYKITLDEIAKELHVSKKTIYKHFGSKEQLLREATFHFITEAGNKITEITKGETPAMVKFVLLMETMATVMAKFQNKWISDMEHHAKDLWLEVDSFRTQKLTANLSKLIEQGIEEGIFKKRPVPIVLQVFISAIRGVINPEFIMHSNYAMQTAMQETISILIDSMLTEKGHKVFSKIKIRS